MAGAALFIGFGYPVRGRERQAVQVFNETMQYWGELQGRGEIESFEAVLLEPHGGDLGGFMMVRGDGDKLSRLRASDDFLRITTRAQLIVENFGVVSASTGEELGRQMAIFEEQIPKLAP